MRRYGERVKPGIRYRVRPGAYAILFAQGRILLTRQAAPQPEYQLPGGGIDPGESPLQALHREVLEETGWRIGGLRRIGAYRRFVYMPDYDLWAEKTCRLYLGRAIRPLAPPLEPHHRAVLLPPRRALECLGSAGDRAVLARLIRAG
ncbi:NUDIX domain-containing protein [Mangrovicoccus algicola]|uniref:NUDIX hydrolase n=1 Tax=Mangrovicoccus algicola TaxID=2771008 RepID=A0A8J6YV76_9RHOB|nr:NUDIX hydrolase [Mangrovicoccus algicola]MBE3638242.1 NUDIX hydrolase [Mangrovicoccus algicola]